MRFGDLDIQAPGILGGELNEAEALGSATWLWMHSASHRNAPVHLLSRLLLPAIKHRQFILASEAGKPVCYLSWACFSEAAETRYLDQAPADMPEQDWVSGDRIWLLDWIAPFGHTRGMQRLVQRRLLPAHCMRALYHRGDERGLRIMEFHGIAVMKAEARAWFDAHPIVRSGSRSDQIESSGSAMTP